MKKLKRSMKEILELISLCKCSVSISINNHKDFYQTVEDYISDMSSLKNETKTETIENIGIDIYNQMIEKNIIVEVQVYPDTPIGSYTVYHYDLEKAINIMLTNLK